MNFHAAIIFGSEYHVDCPSFLAKTMLAFWYCLIFGLTISTKKTEVMYQPVPNKQYQEPQITVNGQTLQAVETFTYLGSTLSRNANIDAETSNRISKASSAFGRLREKVLERRGISLKTKLKVYRAVVLTTLLYSTVVKPGPCTDGTKSKSITSI
ncbi:hypothetical protein ACOMHN_040427 [Nucella lapillus]